MPQINTDIAGVVINYRADPGERVAVTLDRYGGIAAGSADIAEHPGTTSTRDAQTGEVRHLRGFGIWPHWGDADSAQAWPMRIEFTYGERGPVSAVIDLGDGLVGRFEFDLPGETPWRLAIEPDASADPSAAGLKRFHLGRVLEQVDEWVRHPFVVRARGGDVAAVPRRRPGRRGADPLEYAIVAAHYVRALATRPTEPVRALVEAAEQRGEYSTAGDGRPKARRQQALTDQRNAVRRARALGMLTAAPVPGRAGGELTALAVDLLRSAGLADLVEMKES